MFCLGVMLSLGAAAVFDFSGAQNAIGVEN
jgi:hypothetical protein